VSLLSEASSSVFGRLFATIEIDLEVCMKVQDIMTRDVKFCGPDTNLAAVAEIMWRNNCGALPVLAESKLIGVVTDRDICIALGTRNWRASDLSVRDVAVKPVFTCGPDEDVHAALKTMRKHQVRRVPVVDDDGKLAGILCLHEIVLQAEKANGKRTAGISHDDIVDTLKAICEHRPAEAAKTATMAASAPALML
jgi:CBS domain-containing protein